MFKIYLRCNNLTLQYIVSSCRYVPLTKLRNVQLHHSKVLMKSTEIFGKSSKNFSILKKCLLQSYQRYPCTKWCLLGIASSSIIASQIFGYQNCVVLSETQKTLVDTDTCVVHQLEYGESDKGIISTLQLVLRTLRIVFTFMPIIICYPITFINNSLSELWWKIVLIAFESLGPTFIKLGQWTSTRRDLFSNEFCNLFSCLHSSARKHSWKITHQIMNTYYGNDWQDYFLFMEKEPIGSGCVAQVYRAYIRKQKFVSKSQNDILQASHTDKIIEPADNTKIDTANKAEGSELIAVAIKVLHPGVYESVRRDLRILRALSGFVEYMFPSVSWLSISECIDQFTDLMLHQIDLRCEAESLIQFNRNFKTVPYVKFPKPIGLLSTKHVLVETLEEGIPISNYVCNEAMGSSDVRKYLAHLGVDALLKMVFIDNLIHGDLHPGNILVQKYPERPIILQTVNLWENVKNFFVQSIAIIKPPLPFRLVLLDCGICKSLSDRDLKNLRTVFKAVILGQGETAAEQMLLHATRSSCNDVNGFKEELGALIMQARSHTVSLAKVQVGELLSQVFSVLMKYHVKMESNFASVMLAIFVLEGLGRSLDPDLDILERARPVLLSLGS